MAKTKTQTRFFCQSCGAQSSTWLGKCPNCAEWNTLVEEIINKPTGSQRSRTKKDAPMATPITKVATTKEARLITPDAEFNRVTGGGLVPGSVVLIGGEPGIGKSTLMLQNAINSNRRVLYVSGEESAQQIKLRADRLGGGTDSCLILCATDCADILQVAHAEQPEIIVIDSVQTLQTQYIDSAPGTVSQLRETASEMIKLAKTSNIPVLLIGHVTKDGHIAGPKVLEHMVDTVLQFQGDRHLNYRMLRTTKNRFGSTSEIGIYEMCEKGLSQVTNPSKILLNQRESTGTGTATAALLEGNRALMVEVQALVSPAAYGTPQRSATGYDQRRLNMLLAVLEKRIGYRLGSQDVFINIAGGLRVEDPAIDLAVCMALVSSFDELPISAQTCFAGEVGLGGEIRSVRKADARLMEAGRLGFNLIVFSKYAESGFSKKDNHIGHIETKKFADLQQLIQHIF